MNNSESGRWPLVLSLASACLVCASFAAESTSTNAASVASEKKAETPPTHMVKLGSLKREVKLDAVFEATQMRPVKLEPKVWVDLTVLEAVPHGTRVKQGDPLVKLDTEKIREQIDDLEDGQPAAKVALELAVAELENLVQTTPLKLEAAKRSKQRTDEDQAHFEKTDKAQKEKAARFNVKNAEERLENAREELQQLEKMYKADDLTEETEEIILKRQKFAVESSEYYLETSKLGAERSLNTLIPREQETWKTQKQDQELALALAEQTLAKTLVQKRLAAEKMKRDQKKSEKRLADLKEDLQSLTVTAPMAGIVYYGTCENGRWATGAAMEKKLVPGGKLLPREVFLTVAAPGQTVLKAVVPENKLSKVKPGLKGQAALVSAPDTKLAVKVDKLSYVPLSGGGFLASLSVRREKGVMIMPGMTCEVTLQGEKKADALLAPKETVFTEGEQKFVFLSKEEGKPEKRLVKTGESDDSMVEIREGLAEGDKILLKRPE